jgi:hypothetical protein
MVASTRVATPGTADIFAAGTILAKIKFTGANDQGPQLVIELSNVMLRPGNPIGLIADAWGQLHLTGEVLADDTGSFGTVTHPDTSLVSPLTSMYYLGKGVIEVQTEADIAYRDVGDAPVFEFVPAVTTLPHYSSRHGVRIKDLEILHEKAATLNLVLEEWTYDNLKLAFLAVDHTGTVMSAGRVASS